MHKTSSRRRRRGDVTPRVDDDDDDDDDHIASTAERSVRIFRPRLDAEWRGEGVRRDGGDERVRRSRARGFNNNNSIVILVLDGADARVRQGGVDRDTPRPIVRVRVARGTLDVDVGGGEESAQRGH